MVKLIGIVLICLFCVFSCTQNTDQQKSSQTQESNTEQVRDYDMSVFTGEILPVFYVKDVMTSLEIYRDILGFKFHHYYDYEKGEDVKTWEKEEPPIWALMSAGDFEFALHKGKTEYELNVGGARHYFKVHNVLDQYEKVKQHDIEISELYERPWMTMFYVVDPDGRIIFFQTPPEELDNK